MSNVSADVQEGAAKITTALGTSASDTVKDVVPAVVSDGKPVIPSIAALDTTAAAALKVDSSRGVESPTAGASKENTKNEVAGSEVDKKSPSFTSTLKNIFKKSDSNLTSLDKSATSTKAVSEVSTGAVAVADAGVPVVALGNADSAVPSVTATETFKDTVSDASASAQRSTLSAVDSSISAAETAAKTASTDATSKTTGSSFLNNLFKKSSSTSTSTEAATPKKGAAPSASTAGAAVAVGSVGVAAAAVVSLAVGAKGADGAEATTAADKTPSIVLATPSAAAVGASAGKDVLSVAHDTAAKVVASGDHKSDGTSVASMSNVSADVQEGAAKISAAVSTAGQSNLPDGVVVTSGIPAASIDNATSSASTLSTELASVVHSSAPQVAEPFVAADSITSVLPGLQSAQGSVTSADTVNALAVTNTEETKENLSDELGAISSDKKSRKVGSTFAGIFRRGSSKLDVGEKKTMLDPLSTGGSATNPLEGEEGIATATAIAANGSAGNEELSVNVGKKSPRSPVSGVSPSTAKTNASKGGVFSLLSKGKDSANCCGGKNIASGVYDPATSQEEPKSPTGSRSPAGDFSAPLNGDEEEKGNGDVVGALHGDEGTDTADEIKLMNKADEIETLNFADAKQTITVMGVQDDTVTSSLATPLSVVASSLGTSAADPTLPTNPAHATSSVSPSIGAAALAAVGAVGVATGVAALAHSKSLATPTAVTTDASAVTVAAPSTAAAVETLITDAAPTALTSHSERAISAVTAEGSIMPASTAVTATAVTVATSVTAVTPVITTPSVSVATPVITVPSVDVATPVISVPSVAGAAPVVTVPSVTGAAPAVIIPSVTGAAPVVALPTGLSTALSSTSSILEPAVASVSSSSSTPAVSASAVKTAATVGAVASVTAIAGLGAAAVASASTQASAKAETVSADRSASTSASVGTPVITASTVSGAVPAVSTSTSSSASDSLPTSKKSLQSSASTINNEPASEGKITTLSAAKTEPETVAVADTNPQIEATSSLDEIDFDNDNNVTPNEDGPDFEELNGVCANFEIDHHQLTRTSYKAKTDWWNAELENDNRYDKM